MKKCSKGVRERRKKISMWSWKSPATYWGCHSVLGPIAILVLSLLPVRLFAFFFFFWEVRVTRGGGVSVLLSSSCIFILSYFVFVLNNPRLSMRVMCVSETLKNIIDCSTLGLKRSHASLSFCPQRKYMSKCQGLKQRRVIWCCQNQIFTSRKCISFINIINTCFQVWILRMIFSEENRLI